MKSFALSSALLLTLAASAGATASAQQAATAPPAISPSEAAAKAELQKVVDTLESSAGIAYSAKITLTTAPPTGAPTTKVFQSTATVAKAGPAHLTVGATPATGEDIYADGKNITILDTATSKYATSSGVPGLNAGFKQLDDDFRSLNLSRDAMMSAAIGTSFPMTYASNGFIRANMPASIKVNTSSSQSTVDGKTVTVIVERYTTPQAILSQTYTVDPSTELPLSIDESYTLPNGTTPSSIRTEFSNFQLLAAAPAASTFAFAPPTGATLVATAPPPPTPVLLANGKTAPNFTV